MLKTYSSSDFKRRLEQGNRTEMFLAEQLDKAGISVVKPEYPEGMSTSYYTKNQVDLIANDHILEVKGQNKVFTCVADYPYDRVFIESQSGFEAKLNRPEFYVSVSNNTGAIIALDVEATRDQWAVEVITDHKRGYSYPTYVASTPLWMDWEEFIGRLK